MTASELRQGVLFILESIARWRFCFYFEFVGLALSLFNSFYSVLGLSSGKRDILSRYRNKQMQYREKTGSPEIQINAISINTSEKAPRDSKIP